MVAVAAQISSGSFQVLISDFMAVFTPYWKMYKEPHAILWIWFP